MTTWPGFGEGTFHDPDRYVREGREKDDVKTTGGLLHFIANHEFTGKLVDPDSDIWELLQPFDSRHVDFGDDPRRYELPPEIEELARHKAEAYREYREQLEKMASRYDINLVPPAPDHPAVARAMEILYPEEE